MPLIRRSITIAAPAEAVWERLVDVPRQPEWMRDLKSVTLDEPGPVRVGSRGIGVVRMFGISSADPIEVTEVDRPRRYALRHLGRFTGTGTFELEPARGGAATRVLWTEDLAFDATTIRLPGLLRRLSGLTAIVRAVAGAGARVIDPFMAPVFHHVFRGDLRLLRELVETTVRKEGTDARTRTSGTP